MRTQYIKLDAPLGEECAEELGKRLYFVSAGIDSFTYQLEDGLICGLELVIDDQTIGGELAVKINGMVNSEIAPLRLLPAKVVWQSSAQRTCQDNIYADMLECGLVSEAGEGQITLAEPLLTLMDVLDARLKGIAVSLFGAKEYRYPTLIPTRVLQDCGYVRSFPHMLMFVTRLHNDIDTYQAFMSELASKDIGPSALTYCRNLDYCLPPTMCYHTYHQYRDREFDPDQNLVVTSKGKSFRFESKAHRTLERLWDFTIREIVFLGTKEFVIDCRRKFMETTFAFMHELGLAGHCEVASDPFFCSQDTAARVFAQKALELKYELHLKVEESRTIAVASFNFHDQVFGEGFNIRQSNGKPIKTACVGFGLERLLYAFLCQYGLDTRDWTPLLTEEARNANRVV